MDCRACGKIGHFAKACHTRNWDEHATPAQAMSCKAYNVRIDEEGKQSLEDARLWRAGEITGQFCPSEEWVMNYIETGNLG